MAISSTMAHFLYAVLSHVSIEEVVHGIGIVCRGCGSIDYYKYNENVCHARTETLLFPNIPDN